MAIDALGCWAKECNDERREGLLQAKRSYVSAETGVSPVVGVFVTDLLWDYSGYLWDNLDLIIIDYLDFF